MTVLVLEDAAEGSLTSSALRRVHQVLARESSDLAVRMNCVTDVLVEGGLAVRPVLVELSESRVLT